MDKYALPVVTVGIACGLAVDVSHLRSVPHVAQAESADCLLAQRRVARMTLRLHLLLPDLVVARDVQHVVQTAFLDGEAAL